MIDVLVYLLHDSVREDIEQAFSPDGFRLTLVESLNEVTSACQADFFDAGLVWPASYRSTANLFTLLEAQGYNYFPIIAVVNNTVELESINRLPVADAVDLPPGSVTIRHIVSAVVRDVAIRLPDEGTHLPNWRGSVEDFDLMDLTRMIEISGEDAELIMTYSDEAGRIFYKNGQIWDALFKSRRGLNALMKLFFWPRGTFVVQPPSVSIREQHLKMPNTQILTLLGAKSDALSKRLENFPDLCTELMKNPFVTRVELTQPQEMILRLFTRAVSTFELLLKLDMDNDQVLSELETLLILGHLGIRSEIEKQIQDVEQQSAFDRMVISLSSVFRKKHTLDLHQLNLSQHRRKSKPPGFGVVPHRPSGAELEQIRQFLRGIS